MANAEGAPPTFACEATIAMLGSIRNNLAIRRVTVPCTMTITNAKMSSEIPSWPRLAMAVTSQKAFAAIDLEFQSCVNFFEQQTQTSAIADYQNDKRLFRMYSDRIQRRAARS